MNQANLSTKPRLRTAALALSLLIYMLLTGCDFSGPNRTTTPTAPSAGSAGAGSSASTGASNSGSTGSTTGSVSQTSSSFPEQQAIIAVANKTRPAVVTVVNKLDPNNTGYGGEARGTGMIVDNQGHIFTNNHVIAG